MSAGAATVIVPTVGGGGLARMLESLAAQSIAHETIVVDNGSADGGVAAACERLPGVELLRLPENAGYTRAVNRGVERASGETVVLLNDDCIVEPQFVQRICAPVDPAEGIVMAAGVMRDWRDSSLIDSAGMELDPTLLVFDYLNGEPVARLEGEVSDPVGPSGAAAAFDRATFLSVGGFDENLFAYWEDVDLVLRLRRLGLRCALARDAIGDHEHSATLGSGSKRKNYLMGFGRGYLLRKWRVLDRRRLGAVLVRDGVLCAGQAVFDRNLAGLRGRLRGYRAATALERYPTGLPLARSPGAASTLMRRARRRARLRARPVRMRTATPRTLAVFHLADTSGPSRSLEAELRWLGGEASLVCVIPGPGRLEGELAGAGELVELDYEAATRPPRGPLAALAEARRLWRDVRAFRALIRERGPELVIAVTSMLPAVMIASRLERVPLLVYCGELFDRGDRGSGFVRTLAGRMLSVLTARLADGIIACSRAVAEQFAGAPVRVETVYPPIGDHAGGDGPGFRARFGVPADASMIASVGYVTEGRAQHMLVHAMPAILERMPEARYVIAGDAFPRPQDLAYRDRLRGLIEQLGLTERVTVAGHVEDVADVYAAADVVVNPALVNESFGRVPFEAAVAGTPSVVTQVGAVTELLRDRTSALIVPPEDPAALAAAVTRLLSDPELGHALVAGARQIVAERLRPERSLAGFRRAVEATLASAR